MWMLWGCGESWEAVWFLMLADREVHLSLCMLSWWANTGNGKQHWPFGSTCGVVWIVYKILRRLFKRWSGSGPSFTPGVPFLFWQKSPKLTLGIFCDPKLWSSSNRFTIQVYSNLLIFYYMSSGWEAKNVPCTDPLDLVQVPAFWTAFLTKEVCWKRCISFSCPIVI